MDNSNITFSPNQIIFKDIIIGTLVYAIVLGFFNDYTTIVESKSFSTTFLASIVLSLLTYGAFLIKNIIVKPLKKHQETHYKILTVFLVWLVMFLSKFVFIWMIDFVFGENITINGFFGILILVLIVATTQKTFEAIFKKLGQNK